MKLAAAIRRIREAAGDANVVTDVNTAVTHGGGPDGVSSASSSSRRTIVQRDGRTVVDSTTHERKERHDG